jgi:hypothetical protein
MALPNGINALNATLACSFFTAFYNEIARIFTHLLLTALVVREKKAVFSWSIRATHGCVAITTVDAMGDIRASNEITRE